MANIEIKYIGVDAGATKTGHDVSKSIGDVEGAAKQASGGVGGFFKDAFAFATGGAITAALGGIANGIGDLVSGMVAGNAEFETYETQFGVLLGSADAAKQRLADLAKFGASTPFELPEVVKADKILQGFGLHSEESAKKFGKSGAEIRRIAGDVASGTGQSFEGMALLLGKFSSGATGEAISRMAELGITTREELTKMGLEFSKSGELLSPLPQAMQVVTDLMDKKYGGMMDKQSATFDGMMSNFQDFMAGTLREAGKPVFESLKGALGDLLTQLQNPAFQGAINAIASLIGNVLSGAIGVVVPIVGNFLEIIENVSRALGSGGGLADVVEMVIGTTLNNFGMFEDEAFDTADGVIAAIEPILDVFREVYDTIAEVVENVSRALGSGGGLLDVVEMVVGTVLMHLGMFEDSAFDVADGVTASLAKVGTVFQAAKETIGNVMGAVVDLIGTELGVVVDFFEDHGDEIMSFVQDTWNNILDIIKLALALINATIVPALKAIAKFIGDHGTEIGNVFKGAWDVISGVIDTALTLIKGVIKLALQLLNGDIDGALGTIKDTFTRVWDNIKQVVQGAWDFISNIVRLAGDAITRLTGQQQSASGITVSYNPNFGQGNNVSSTSRPGISSASNSYSLAGDTYNVSGTNVAQEIQQSRKTATQQAMLRAAVGT